MVFALDERENHRLTFYHSIYPMREERLYDRLLGLPLFQGLSGCDIDDIVGKTKFGFHKSPANKIYRQEGEPCLALCFLLQGEMSVETSADDHGYSIIEQMESPGVLQPERLFGLVQRYSQTFTTLTPCQFMTLDKQEVLRLSDAYVIFRLNLLNILSTQSQRLSRTLWHVPGDTRQRIVRFFASHCSRPAGPKTVHIKITRLAEEINVGRQAASDALNALQHDGLLTFSRGIIKIPALERLLT